ncbi:hypothetical protein Tco_0823855 [Tanacetum coccineum]|uniref:Uncharacterized protein n=1 Tax=Tanacetum coccineum TaxID=301880 RepID=A0ABQ5AN55_9ASTR
MDLQFIIETRSSGYELQIFMNLLGRLFVARNSSSMCSGFGPAREHVIFQSLILSGLLSWGSGVAVSVSTFLFVLNSDVDERLLGSPSLMNHHRGREEGQLSKSGGV